MAGKNYMRVGRHLHRDGGQQKRPLLDGLTVVPISMLGSW